MSRLPIGALTAVAALALLPRVAAADPGSAPDDALLQRYLAAFEPDAAERTTAQEAPRCATDLVADLQRAMPALTPQWRHRVAWHVDPIYRARVEAGGVSWLQGDADAAGRATCFQPSDLQAGSYARTTNTDHFSVRWNPSADATEQRIDFLADQLEHSLGVEVDDLGFLPPNRLGTFQMLVMVQDLASSGTGGYTTVYYCADGFMPYVVVNSDWMDSNRSIRSVAAHELFHGVQMAYAFRHMFQEDSPDRWFVEASAVFMETEVYPDNHEPQFSQALRWLMEPHRALTTWDETGFQYGTWLMPASVRQELGDASWFRPLWEQMRSWDLQGGYEMKDVFDAVLADRGTDFLTQVEAFQRNGTLGRWDNPFVWRPDELDEQTNGGLQDGIAATWDRLDYPVDAAVSSASGKAPGYLGTSIVAFDGDGVGDGKALQLEFVARAEEGGAPVSWTVQALAVSRGDEVDRAVLSLERVEPDDGEPFERGAIQLDGFGVDADLVYLVASPGGELRDGEVSWGYTAALVDDGGTDGFRPVPEPVEPEPDGQACACAGGGVGAWPMLLGFVARRRRRGD